MRGNLVRRVWEHNPALYAPARYRRACAYEAFIPFPLSDLGLQVPGDVAGIVSDAEKAIADLNRRAGPELMPLARLLLRTESIASSKVEGMQVDARTLARAEVNQEAAAAWGRRPPRSWPTSTRCRSPSSERPGPAASPRRTSSTSIACCSLEPRTRT